MEYYLINNNVISSCFAGLFSEKAVTFIADVIDQIPNPSSLKLNIFILEYMI